MTETLSEQAFIDRDLREALRKYGIDPDPLGREHRHRGLTALSLAGITPAPIKKGKGK
jgi:hypothetical protein